MKTLGVIEVRPDARSRASGPPRLAADIVLALAARRLTDSVRLDGVAVWAPEGAAAWMEAAVPPDVPLISAPGSDALGGFTRMLDTLGADSAVLVQSDHLLIDPIFIDRLAACGEESPECAVVSYSVRHPAGGLQPVDALGQWCRADAVARAERLATRSDIRSQPLAALWSRPELFPHRLIALPKELDDHELRLSINVQDDWEHAEALMAACAEYDLDWRRIAPLLRRPRSAVA